MVTMAPKPTKLAALVECIGGELLGNPDTVIDRIASLQSAGPGDITFLSQARYRPLLKSTRAAAVILPYSERNTTDLPRILCDDPYLYFAQVSRFLEPAPKPIPGVHPSAVIEADAHIAATAQIDANSYVGYRVHIGEGTWLGPGCYIGDDSVIGTDSKLHNGVSVYPGCRIGNRVIFHAGVVIGADGFGLALKDGAWLKIPQTGGVIIGDDVEIGANSTIDRGALDDTVIEDGVKLDNQIQVGHNVHIGAHSALAGCVGIAGSARIGRHCTIGGGAIVLGHLEIADHVNISAATVITKSILKSGTYTGVYPFSEHRQWGRSASVARNLDALEARIRKLEDLLSAVTPDSPKRISESIDTKIKRQRTRKSTRG